MRLEFNVYAGPNLILPCPAVAMLVFRDAAATLPMAALTRRIEAALPPELASAVSALLTDSHFETLAAAIAVAAQDGDAPERMPVKIERVAGSGGRITLGSHIPEATIAALRFGADIAHWLLSTPETVDVAWRLPELRRLLQWVASQQPDPYARPLLRAARRRGIPFTSLIAGSRVWVYGEGCHGVQFFEASNTRDSSIGVRITTNKVIGNALVTSLGYPGVQHALAGNLDSARQIAGTLGYPVVVKPPDAGGGRGVSAWINDDAALAAAFARATAGRPAMALIEKHVAGEDHRLMVVGGKFAWAVRRTPARVNADGVHTVADLVALENHGRSQQGGPAAARRPIVLDEDALALLYRQGLTPESRPAAGSVVRLSDVANLARGGTRQRIDAVHPDNCAMAEAIARAFHLDTAGLDFMTPDITRSWREVPCAVLEVNATPGFGSPDRAEHILSSQFPPGNDGRVPGVLLVGASAGTLTALAARMAADGRTVGVTDGTHTRLGEQTRGGAHMALAARVRGLVLDPACEALAIGATAAEIEQAGLPLQRCHVAVVVGELPAPLRALLSAHTGTLLQATDEAAAAQGWEALRPFLPMGN